MGYTVAGYINTSVDDCKTSLMHCTDIGFLRVLSEECEKIGHKTRASYVKSRINSLVKLQREVASD